MDAAALAGCAMVPLIGAALCAAPLATRPNVQFGVRVPPGELEATVIRRARRGFLEASAAVAVCATVVAFAIGRTAAWPSRVVILAEVAADIPCFWWAHQRIVRTKSTEQWFAGRRQTVVTDTTWRSDAPRFPVAWLLPALGLIGATVVVGLVRYPHLPGHLSSGGHRYPTTPLSALAPVAGQVWVTGVWSGLLALVHRSRPDLDTADPAASLRSYRRALGIFARAGLVLLAGIDLTILLGALRLWRLLSGLPAGLVALPFVLALVGFLGAGWWAGRERARTAALVGATDRDDDRFWKGGLLYVNGDDPAVLVGARFGFGWTVNLGNRAGRLLVVGFLAGPAALIVVRLATGA